MKTPMYPLKAWLREYSTLSGDDTEAESHSFQRTVKMKPKASVLASRHQWLRTAIGMMVAIR